MISLEGLISHGPDLPLDQRLEWPQQLIETRWLFQHIQRLHHRLDGRHRPRLRGLAQAVA